MMVYIPTAVLQADKMLMS